MIDPRTRNDKSAATAGGDRRGRGRRPDAVRAQALSRLPAGTRRLDFHYTALSFASVPGTVLRHRLDGLRPGLGRCEAGPDDLVHQPSATVATASG